MRRRYLLAVILGLLLASPASAAVRLRAIYPNPPGSDEGEWVAVENLDATPSGKFSLRDTVGSVKTYTLDSLPASELRLIYATQSGITLNNTGEAVELLAEGIVLERSPPYVASAEGRVWLQLESGWREVALSEFNDRAERRNWLVGPESTSNEERESIDPPQTSDLDRGETKPVDSAPTSVIPSIRPEYRLPRLQATSTATVAANWSWPIPPEPDYQAEIDLFLDWKRRALLGSLALLFGGGCWLLLVSPPLFTLWRWLRDELML